MSLRRVWLVAAWMAGSWAGAAGAEGTEVAATWKRYELDFHYMGFTTRYSCEGLRDKVRQLLLHSGVVVRRRQRAVVQCLRLCGRSGLCCPYRHGYWVGALQVVHSGHLSCGLTPRWWCLHCTPLIRTTWRCVPTARCVIKRDICAGRFINSHNHVESLAFDTGHFLNI